jgi:predicted nucleic acid-binding protein
VTSAVDSNVVIALLSEDDSLNSEAEKALERGLARGDLIICGPVYVEVSAFPGRLEGRVDDFLSRTGIDVDWDLEEKVWREAARASQAYAARREVPRKLPRRVAADFIIGAHALVRKYPLLTMDRRGFRTAFPNLQFAPESF